MDVLAPQKKVEEAQRLLELGANRARDAVAPTSGNGDTLEETGRKDSSIEALARAAALLPSEPRLQFNLGLRYLDKRDYHRAKTAFNRAVQLDVMTADIITTVA